MKPIRVTVYGYPAGRHDYPFHPLGTVLTIDLALVEPSRVEIWMAPSEASHPQYRRKIYDSAFQTNPGADQTQYLTNICVSVPLAAGTNNWMQLRITKANNTANIDWCTKITMGPGC